VLWNWQQDDWGEFRYDQRALAGFEEEFLHNSGVLLGATKHIADEKKTVLIVDIITGEALKTSEIEGEYLNRDSLQSSIRRNLGLDTDNRRIPPAELGIAEMIVDLYQNFSIHLTQKTLFSWHKMVTKGRRDLQDLGRYRTDSGPMQIISGPIHEPKIHFEAPPSKNIKKEMDQFIFWFNQTAPGGENSMAALTRAGIAHLYFVSIHPFEDGNGRIARAIVEKTLAQCVNQPTLISLSHTIQNNRKAYYAALEVSNKGNEITTWLTYFAQTVLDAQKHTQATVNFLIEKTKFFDKFRGQLNERQGKVLTRMFSEGVEGFKGGLSAENYISISKTSRATATRDLKELTAQGALIKTGKLKSTRYFLNIMRSSLDNF